MGQFGKLALCILTLCMTVSVGCKTNPAETSATADEVKSPDGIKLPTSTAEAQEDMIGNWVVDPAASRVNGLKDAAKAKTVFSIVMEPNGSRTLYRDGQIAEKGTLEISKVEPNGRVIGRFTLDKGGPPMGVTIDLKGDSEMVWTFEEGKRLEVFRRQLMEPDDSEGETQPK